MRDACEGGTHWKGTSNSDHADRLLDTSFATEDIRRSLLESEWQKMAKMGKPENKFLPPRNDFGSPWFIRSTFYLI